MTGAPRTATPKAVQESEDGVEGQVRASVHLAYTMAGIPETQQQQPSTIRPEPPSMLAAEREFGLYNGVSNRARGWKSKSLGHPVDNRAPTHATMRRWDGATKTWQPWDNLRRDPELWLPHGNCYVHLHGVGQSRRGPAFRIPFVALLDARCYPLLDRCLVPRQAPNHAPAAPNHLRGMRQPDAASPQNGNEPKLDLYIPAPPTADKDQAFLFHLATRNFFAWLVGKCLVGKDLGSAMITLLNTMADFRCYAQNNVADLLFYLEQTGYLDMRNQPHFALAALHLAEFFQLRELYIDAFAHCTGMCDRLFLSPEYQHVSSVSRKLIRRARSDMDARLNTAGLMLKTFLDEELSEAHLGLPEGSRLHMDRFRSFLEAFYTAKFGYYPPAPLDQRNSVFEPTIFYVMRHDFECLYGFLVDRSFNTAEDSLFLATGGICTLQCVQSFDMRHKFESLPQPLPMLPDTAEPSPSKRKSWLARNDKTKPDHRLLAHAALIRASNIDDACLLENDLVRAYRKFEEDFIFSPVKVDKPEKISHVDARKVRWILVYCIYQTLRSVTEPPPEVRHTEGVPYHLAVATDLLPPWREDRVTYPPASSHRGLPLGHVAPRGRAMSMSAATSGPSGWNQRQPLRVNTEIKPDIDYFAQAKSAATTQNTPDSSAPSTPRRSRSLTRGLSRSNTFRRSLSIFSKHARSGSPSSSNQDPAPTAAAPRRGPSYHEIVVHGYGNGTNSVHMATEYVTGSQKGPHASSTGASANRSLSNASKSSDGSAVSANTTATSTTVSTAPSSAPSIHETPPPEAEARGRSHTVVGTSASPQPGGRTVELRNEAPKIPTRSSSVRSDSSSHYSSSSPSPTATSSSSESPVPANALKIPRSRFRKTIGGLEELLPSVSSSQKSPKAMRPSPLRVQRDYSNLRAGAGPEEWHEVQEEMEKRFREDDDDVKPMWEQFSDLGGLTKLV